MANKEEQIRISNKAAILQVIGCLIKNPLLLCSNDYSLTVDDFTEQFHRIIFGAIANLAEQGFTSITFLDIDQLLSRYPTQYDIFINNNGIAYIQKAVAIAEEDKFQYYYNTIKKVSLLNNLSAEGFSINKYYDPNILDQKQIDKMTKQFDDLTTDGIINEYECKLAVLKDNFAKNKATIQQKSSDGLRELKQKFKEKPEVGLPLMSQQMTTVYRGQRLKKLYLESAAQGVGKSRRMAGESAHLAVSQIYDVEKKEWVPNSWNQSVLYISTELEIEEVQTMWLAFISGVPENLILDGHFSAEEEKRIDHAIELLEESNLFFAQIGDYDIDDIENLIRKFNLVHGVKYVYYDYLSTTCKIMGTTKSKTKIDGLREDQILLMFSTRLKNLANELNIFIWTATQLSGEWKTAKDPDQQMLRGAKSISDKVDIGSIMLPVRPEIDNPIIDSLLTRGFSVVPTHVIHIYKVRRGEYNNIRLYIHFDRSTCRITDCFATDQKGMFLPIKTTNLESILDKTSAGKKFENEFNNEYGFEF